MRSSSPAADRSTRSWREPAHRRTARRRSRLSLRALRVPRPADRPYANLNTATFDRDGLLWFTGQQGVFGRLDPKSGAMAVFDAPRGPGPYGIATCPDGNVYFASLAGSYVGRIVRETGGAVVLVPPPPGHGPGGGGADPRRGARRRSGTG